MKKTDPFPRWLDHVMDYSELYVTGAVALTVLLVLAFR